MKVEHGVAALGLLVAGRQVNREITPVGKMLGDEIVMVLKAVGIVDGWMSLLYRRRRLSISRLILLSNFLTLRNHQSFYSEEEDENESAWLEYIPAQPLDIR
jgi:hypothetical protein